MIPASYMFKNAYRSAWEEPDVSAPEPQEPSFTGGLKMMLQMMRSLLSHRLADTRLPTTTALAQRR